MEGDGGTMVVGYGIPRGEDGVWRGCMRGAERYCQEKGAKAGKLNKICHFHTEDFVLLQHLLLLTE